MSINVVSQKFANMLSDVGKATGVFSMIKGFVKSQDKIDLDPKTLEFVKKRINSEPKSSEDVIGLKKKVMKAVEKIKKNKIKQVAKGLLDSNEINKITDYLSISLTIMRKQLKSRKRKNIQNIDFIIESEFGDMLKYTGLAIAAYIFYKFVTTEYTSETQVELWIEEDNIKNDIQKLYNSNESVGWQEYGGMFVHLVIALIALTIMNKVLRFNIKRKAFNEFIQSGGYITVLVICTLIIAYCFAYFLKKVITWIKNSKVNSYRFLGTVLVASYMIYSKFGTDFKDEFLRIKEGF